MQNLYVRLAPYLVQLIEFLLMAAAGVLILFSSRNSSRNRTAVFGSMERAFGPLARHKHLSVVAVGLSVIAIRVALIPILGIPEPRWNDEFSYLLAADTFAHGRLTNPTHPMWIHFESFHIIQRPTYMSMYPPAQGMVLGAGQLVGHPWIGQLLITAAMCSALCWMLRAWLPPTWALLGAAIGVLRLGLLSYWMNTYWGASIAALGGALVLGAWPRLRRRSRMRDSLLMGFGLILLVNSRPYEGLVFSIPVAGAMLWWLIGGRGAALRPSLPRVVLPLFVVLACGAVATGYYYRSVTGDPLRMAYQVNRATYATAPYFLWQTPRPEPIYHHEVIRDFYRWELQQFEENITLAGYFRRSGQKLYSWWQYYLGLLLTLPFIAFPWAARQRKMWLPLAICAAMLVGFAVQTWTLPHYFSPATGAFYILLVQCMRQLRLWRPSGRPAGQALVRAMPLLACSMILLRVTAAAIHVPIEPAWPRGNLERARLQRQLQQRLGGQLVIVRYGPHHDVDREWVYNDADIDAAKVVWARDMGGSGNKELRRYFSNRTVWLLDGDADVPQVAPYSE